MYTNIGVLSPSRESWIEVDLLSQNFLGYVYNFLRVLGHHLILACSSFEVISRKDHTSLAKSGTRGLNVVYDLSCQLLYYVARDNYNTL